MRVTAGAWGLLAAMLLGGCASLMKVPVVGDRPPSLPDPEANKAYAHYA